MKIASRTGISAIVGGSLLLAAAVPGPAAAGSEAAQVEWELQLSLEGELAESRFWDVAASGADDAWAVGWGGVFPEVRPFAFRYDGSSWAEVPNPLRDGYGFTGVDTTPTGSAWVAAGDRLDFNAGEDLVLQWDGDAWTRHEAVGTIGGDVAAIADDDVWYAAGVPGGGAVAQHWNGRKWKSKKLPGRPNGISTVDARSTDDVWVAGSRDGQPYAAHWDGRKWRNMSPPEVTPPEGAEEFFASVGGLVAVSDDEAWAIGSASWDSGFEAMVYRFDGTEWREVEDPDFGDRGEGTLTDIGIGPDGGIWLVPRGWDFLFKRVAGGWQEVPLPSEEGTATILDAVAAAGGRIWATGLAESSDFDFHGVIYQATTQL